MDPSQRGALLFVRFLASCLLGLSAIFLALLYVDQAVNHHPAAILTTLLRALPALVGVVMLVKARPLAEWLADLLDQ